MCVEWWHTLPSFRKSFPLPFSESDHTEKGSLPDEALKMEAANVSEMSRPLYLLTRRRVLEDLNFYEYRCDMEIIPMPEICCHWQERICILTKTTKVDSIYICVVLGGLRAKLPSVVQADAEEEILVLKFWSRTRSVKGFDVSDIFFWKLLLCSNLDLETDVIKDAMVFISSFDCRSVGPWGLIGLSCWLISR